MVALPSSPIRSGGKEPRAPESVIEVDGLSFALHKSGRRRTLQITVERSGDLAIIAPTGVSFPEITDFVQEKLLWVHTKIAEKERLQRRAPIKEFVDGEGFLYLGKSYRLRLVDQQFADLSLTAGRFLLRRNRLPRARETFVAWYSRNALRWFKLKIAEHARRMNVQIAEVKIQDLGYRWGSFSPDGRVQFHWKAILLPPRIAEYIVVHELAHANHSNHSAAFWHHIEQHMPDWQQRKSWLAEHGVEVEGL
jgi:predicted metal-dependent hydrolase